MDSTFENHKQLRLQLLLAIRTSNLRLLETSFGVHAQVSFILDMFFDNLKTAPAPSAGAVQSSHEETGKESGPNSQGHGLAAPAAWENLVHRKLGVEKRERGGGGRKGGAIGYVAGSLSQRGGEGVGEGDGALG